VHFRYWVAELLRRRKIEEGSRELAPPKELGLAASGEAADSI
jgi:hypothetical protein